MLVLLLGRCLLWPVHVPPRPSPALPSDSRHCTGFFLALLLERCLFVDFPFFNRHFAHELDFSWGVHAERLLRFGHDANATEHQPQRVPFGYDAFGGSSS